MNKANVKKLLKQFDFETLFFEELGWDELKIDNIQIQIKEVEYTLQPVAQKRGVQVFLCLPDADGKIPVYHLRKQIENKLYPLIHENMIIFINAARSRLIWQWVAREPGKPAKLNHIEYNTNQSGELLTQRLNQFAFTMEEEDGITLLEVTKRVKDSMYKDKVTKKFYEKFKKEHDAFMAKICGIPDEEDKKWYTSLLLNRLMFIYFIQYKGFLDNDLNYLRNRLQTLKLEKQNDKFYNFYRYFLLRLFHEGLGAPDHDAELERLIGKIPYLNGGLFDQHELEKEYSQIQIPDEAFEKIFAFFDDYHWHLDNRPLKKDDEINPDVIGYIFEKYINQKQMGAYYTKEDITEYISKNTIIPFLFDETRRNYSKPFSGEDSIWKLLQQNPDDYFYDAVKKGCDKPLPYYIEIGVDPQVPDLFERRKDWNKPADEEYALPTEIWREVVARRQRYQEVKTKMQNGEIDSINDLITYNLNIRQFTLDVIKETNDHELVKQMWNVVNSMSVLDPTCGSGAFLFAAMNILEEIYEALINRMDAFVNDLLDEDNTYRSDKFQPFKKVLHELSRHITPRYFIYKSIIINNLYGVDIMDEAVEIAKLRLFLKLAAEAEKDDNAPNLGIEPLPDIDFHLKAGNTLVGFTHPQQVKDLAAADLRNIDYVDELNEQLELVSKAFTAFHQMQKLADYSSEEYHAAKEMLKKKLDSCRSRLNEFLAEDYGKADNMEKFLETHKPFHWFLEFHQIMSSGGFDVIIGNPPYVGYTRKDKKNKKSISQIYDIKNYRTRETNNLYAYVIEKSFSICIQNGYTGMIIPISAFSNASMLKFQNLIKEYSLNYISNFHQRPAALFEGVLQRLSIFLTKNIKISTKLIYTTKVYRWLSENRNLLFYNINYLNFKQANHDNIMKVEKKIETSIYSKIKDHIPICNFLYSEINRNSISYRTAGGGYWVTFLNSEFDTTSLSNKVAYFKEIFNSKVFTSVLNSNLFWWFYSINYDQFNFKDYMIFGFKFNYPKIAVLESRLIDLSDKLENELISNAESYTINSITRGSNSTLTYNKQLSKSTIDEIDKVLAQHYGFTDEELDFIINYDIKYRMGKSWLEGGEVQGEDEE